MILEQIYTGCLAQGAYYIESNGEAAIIDPLREVQPYIDRANKNNATIKYVLETHFHADFVSGHLDLSKKTNATIVYGPNAKPSFDAHIAVDNEEIVLGNIKLKVIHTPGHTIESTCYLLIDENGEEKYLFTGDTLFIGDVGRPDLAQKVSSDLTQEKLAGYLYESLNNKILPLSDDIIVYPAHGAGSACGKNMSKETFDTLGNQKKVNYALQPQTKEEFIVKVLDGLSEPPQYFPENVLLNINGYESLDTIMENGLRELSTDDFSEIVKTKNALILDTRKPNDFAKGFIPNSINIGIDGGFAPWVGALITNINQPIVIIADEGREKEVITRLSRVGYDNTLGILKGGFKTWKEENKPFNIIETLEPNEINIPEITLNMQNVLDVRKPSEYLAEHVVGAINVPLDTINSTFTDLDPNTKYFIHCQSGYRSMVFASILKAKGFQNLVNINGGFKGIQESQSLPTSAFVCPSER